MRILHVFSHRKWTGPAELALHVAAGQVRRGHEVAMAVGDPGTLDRYFPDQVVERGVELVSGMHLKKHFNVRCNRQDTSFLASLLQRRTFDLVHSHMLNDHWIVGRARARARSSIPVVRTSYEAGGPARGLRSSYLLRRHTNALVLCSPDAERAARARLGFLGERIFCIEPGVDTARFDPARRLPSRRVEFGIAPEALVVGLVARIQEHREFTVFLEAMQIVRREIPALHAVIFGTASESRTDRLVGAPARSLGIADRVTVVTRQRGDAFVAALQSVDVQVYLVPGSDGSCRAVREAMSLGQPVVAARRGMLPEIVENGRTGRICEPTSASIAAAVVDLARDPELRRRMGAAAREAALRRFGLERLVESHEQVLGAALGARRAGSGLSTSRR